MKLTKTQLKEMIRESIRSQLTEQSDDVRRRIVRDIMEKHLSPNMFLEEGDLEAIEEPMLIAFDKGHARGYRDGSVEGRYEGENDERDRGRQRKADLGEQVSYNTDFHKMSDPAKLNQLRIWIRLANDLYNEFESSKFIGYMLPGGDTSKDLALKLRTALQKSLSKEKQFANNRKQRNLGEQIDASPDRDDDRRRQAISIYSDVYKELYNVRPRHKDFSSVSTEEIEAMTEKLMDEVMETDDYLRHVED